MKAAPKLPVRFLTKGQIIQDEKGVRVKTPIGEVSNLRLMGRVVSKFIKRDRSFGSLDLDDETDVIQVRFFGNSVKLMENARMGDLIDVVGRIKIFQDLLYVVSDGFSVLEDINWELLRKLELADREEGGPKNEILAFVREKKEVSAEDVAKKWEDSQAHIDDLKCNGEIYEPTPGVLRPVE